MKHRLKRSISLLCALAMLVSMLPATALAAVTEEDISGGINGYVADMQADEPTSDSWEDAFYVSGTQRSEALNGKIWADKSVEISKDDPDAFEVTFSALGQTFASQEASQENVAYDVVFVVDVSRSMSYQMQSDDGWTTRMDATVEALNSTAESLMANENNRMAVVRFSSNAETYVPLGHYSKSNYYESSYFTKDGNYDITFHAQEFRGSQENLTSGTNQQQGYFEAGDILENATMPSNVKRIPVVIMLTDGDPDTAARYPVTSNWKTGQQNDGSKTVANPGSSDHFYTICTAAYHKDLIQDHYRSSSMNNDSSITAKFYTIGLGLSGDNNTIMLDPSTRNTIENNLSRAINNNPAGSMGFSTYDYADMSWTNESMTAEQLNGIFEAITNDLGDLGVSTDVGESAGERNRVTYYDTLGENVRFTGEMQLKVPTYQIEENTISKGETRTYTLTPYAAVDAGDITANTPMEMANAPDYLAAGGVIEFRPETVAVNGVEGNNVLDSNNTYDKAAQDNLSVKVQMLSSGKRQLQVDIPPELMAYNVFITTQEDGQETKTYFENSDGPLQLTYGIQLREDTEAAGSYLIGAPAETYVEFYPSSAQDEDNNYVMPYYWPGGQFDSDSQSLSKSGTGVEGASNYVYSATKGNNNNIRIYLGNNGLYKLEGKQLTFHLFWEDNSNQDGKRPDSVTVQLYREKLESNSAEVPTEAPNLTEQNKVGAPIVLNISQSVENQPNEWMYTTEDLPVYSDDGNFLRYWLKITSAHEGYTDALNTPENPNNGLKQEATDGSVWYCFSVDKGMLVDAKLDVKLTHVPETIDYKVTKNWVGDDGTSATIQLLANGKAATNLPEGESASVTLSEDENWTHEWKGIPAYANGEPITYSVIETAYEPANQYTTTYGDPVVEEETGNTSVTITNTQGGNTRSFLASVVWDDANNQDGVRPTEVTLKLKAKVDDTPMEDDVLIRLMENDALVNVDNLKLTANMGNGYAVTWTNIPRYNADNQLIEYYIVELNEAGAEIGSTEEGSNAYNDDYKVTAYTAVAQAYMSVTNTHEPAKVNITINKTWTDNNNQDGIRPSSVSGTLYKKVDGGAITPVQTYGISGDNWSTTINGLPANEGGKAITYYVSEHQVNSYTLTTDSPGTSEQYNGVNVYPVNITGNTGSITLTNTHKPTPANYTATFNWADNNNADGARPTSINVTLTATPAEGQEKTYTITLNVDNGGVASVNGTPTLPEGASATVDENGELKITGLPANQGGKTISYSMAITNAGSTGYTTNRDGYTPNSSAFTLSYTSAPVTLGFTKAWDDDSDAAKMRPSADAYGQYLTLKRNVSGGQEESVNVQPSVTANGNQYTVTYNNLPKRDAAGKEYTYTVTESTVPNYTASQTSVTLTANNENQLTNTYAQEVYSSITVTKQWSGDADAPTGTRPTDTSVQNNVLGIVLYRTGTTTNGIEPDNITDNEDGTWTYTWTNVPKTDKDGNTINYVAYESKVPTGYTATTNNVAVTTDGEVQSNVTITNTYTGAASTGTLTINKTWANDGDYKDTSRPTEVEFLITGTYDGGTNNISRTVTMNSDGNAWNSVQVENLPVSVNGQTVTYTVEEINVPTGYAATVNYGGNANGVTLIANDNIDVTVTNTYDAGEWTLTYNANGGENEPDAVTVEPEVPSATVDVAEPGEMTYKDGYLFIGWSKTINRVVVEASDLEANPLYNADEDTSTPDSIELEGDTTLYAVWAADTNDDGIPDYQQQTITVNVVWEDQNNTCGIRPDTISFTLGGDSTTIGTSNGTGVEPVLVTTDNGTKWTYKFLVDDVSSLSATSLNVTNVPVKDHADKKDTEGYATTGDNVVAFDKNTNTFTITLTHTPETTEHKVTKNWVGEVGSTATATFQLYGNGEALTETQSIAANETTATWTDLEKYEGGKLITYHAVETQVKDGDEDITNEFQVTYDWNTPGTSVITNTHNSELRNITLLYQWDDANNAAGERPESVTVQLYDASGNAIEDTAKSLDVVDDSTWTVTWENLARYDSTGAEISYEAHVVAYTDGNGLHEVNLDSNDNELTGSDYSFSVMSFGQESVFLMNSALDNNTATFTVNKEWEDKENEYKTRPDSIWVTLKQNDTVYASVQLNSENDWAYTWTNLPEMSNGTPYAYTVEEGSVPGYTGNVKDNTITNTLDALRNPEEHQLTVTFVYNNGDPNTKQDVNFGGTATEPTPAPTWDGHVFMGWYQTDDFTGSPYVFTTPVTTDITLYAKWVSTHDTDGDGNLEEDADDHHYVTFVYQNASATHDGTAIAESTQIEVPCHSDYTFTAAASSGYILNTPSIDGSATLVSNGSNKFTLDDITSDITVTITATRQSTGGGGSGGGGGSTTPKPELEKGEHFAYIIGYTDGTVRPQNNITRAEVATIFFRLLTDESREEFFADTHPYSDVEEDAWYKNAIATLNNAGIITGYPDGTFRPNNPITRAELAAIASRFDDVSGGDCRLTDIEGHWAEELIASAYNKGWVNGYPDGTFRPDQYITRAEVMTLVNRVLEREVDQDGMLEDMVTWSDNQPDNWYYEAVQEATNSHDYSRDEGETIETWTEITPPRDWSELEK